MPISPTSIELDKVVYAYLLSFQNQEEKLVVTNYQQKVLYCQGAMYHFAQALQVVPWNKRSGNKPLIGEMYRPRTSVWIVPNDSKVPAMYPGVGKPAARIKEAYSLSHNLYDLLVQEHNRMRKEYGQIAAQRGLEPKLPNISDMFAHLLSPSPSARPDSQLEERVRKR
ncbi:MAG: hypothetical protein AABX37_05565 [Nanoarchaeota archaeon]